MSLLLKIVLDAIRATASTRVGAPKYRCVNADYFSYNRRWELQRFNLIHDKGLSEIEADAVLRKLFPGASPVPDVKAEIARNVDWVFSRATPTPQRYNTIAFNCLYTAKLPETAAAESRYHYNYKVTQLKSAGIDVSPFRYLIFSVEFSGKLFDLRGIAEIQSEICRPDHFHPDCYAFPQNVAVHLYKECDGLAVPSVRERGGSCCPIFVKATVSPGEVVVEGSFPP